MKTIYREGIAEFTEKKSRFIGQAFPVESEDAAAEHIEAVKRANAKLTGHIPFAWIIGARSKQSDAGEPSGTAGTPIANFFSKSGITNILVTVTRHYGGIHLGASGLIRAYGTAAKEAVLNAGVIEKIIHNKFSVICPYNLQGKFQHEFIKQGYTITNTTYTDAVELTVLAPQDAKVAAEATDISAGLAKVTLLTSPYCAEIDEKLVEF